VLFKKKNLIYPFSKARVYFNAAASLIALVVCIILLATYSTVLFLVCYLFLSTLTSFVFLKIKIILLIKMQESELEEYAEYPEEEEGNQKWKIILIAIGLAFFLLLPVISTQFLDPVWWFVGFSGFVTGMSISEVVLYFSVEH